MKEKEREGGIDDLRERKGERGRERGKRERGRERGREGEGERPLRGKMILNSKFVELLT